jgi:membrane protein
MPKGSFRGTEKFKRIVLPGFEGVPLSEVFTFVVKGFGKGVLVTRASSIAFNLLIALLPASIFLFTLIPFIPVQNFQQELIKLFESMTPSEAHSLLESTIIEVITSKKGGLLIFMFIATMIFSTNGIHAIIHAFVVSSHNFRARSWIQQRKISVVLLMVVIFMIAVSGFLLIYGKMAIHKLQELQYLEKNLVYYLLLTLKWIVIVVLLFLAISFLYWLAPARRSDFRFISPGSIVATFLFILTSLGFSAYVNNFGPYNRLYGSIGTLIVILIWLYLNSIALLIGFELNVSIKEASSNNGFLNNPSNCNGGTVQPAS